MLARALLKSIAGNAPYLLTLDVGTSSIRGRLFDRSGEWVDGIEARGVYRMSTTVDGAVSADPVRLFEDVCSCVAEVVAAAGGAPIAGVAVATFWHSLMGIDASGAPTTAVISWADTRPSGAAAELRRRLSEQDVHARTGCRLHASYLPAKLLWLSETEPEAFAATTKWLSFGEYLQWRLTGELRCSVSMASATGLFDQNRQVWDQEIASSLPLELDQLSPLTDLDTPIGEATRWPELRGVPWFAALGDGACSNVGSGCTNEDRLAVNIGTSGAMRLVWRDDSGPLQVPFGLWRYRLDRKRSLLGGALSEGGNLWAWLQSALQLSPESEEASISSMGPDAHGLTVLPFLAGERSPGWADNARATISGISLDTEPLDLVRACLESVAYRFGLVHGLLGPLLPGDPQIIASGSAISHSPAWLQILADVFGRSVFLSAEAEATSRGAALLGLEALKLLPELSGVTVEMKSVFKPSNERHARYVQAMERQQRLYERVVEGRDPSVQPTV